MYDEEYRRRFDEIEALKLKPPKKFTAQMLAAVDAYHQSNMAELTHTKLDQAPQINRHIALYARISTRDKGQETENQLHELRRFAGKFGWEITKEYIDQASGKTSDRTQFQQLFVDASQGKFDLVLFWSLDRFSREGVLETLQHLQRLTAVKVDWKSYTEQYLDSCGMFREAVLAILATIAKQERVRISERTLAGISRARAQGKPFGRPKVICNRQRIYELSKAGTSLRQIAKQMNVTPSTVRRIVVEWRERENGKS